MIVSIYDERNWGYWSVVAAFMTMFLASVPEDALCGRKALVIGNSNYFVDALKNPINDAKDMSRVLEEVGFEVFTVLDARKMELDRAVKQFSSKVTRNDVALFYYAGHALQINNENYLIPIGIRNGGHAVKLTDAMNSFNHADISIIIVDACRNSPNNNFIQKDDGTLIRSSRGVVRKAKTGLAPPKRSIESFVAYSTDIGNFAEDGTGRNSTFTKHLLRYIKKPGLRMEAVFKRVREAVARETSGTQIPWDSSSITGDFYFVK